MKCPVRLVVSEKVGEGKVEWKERDKEKTEILGFKEAVENLRQVDND